MNKSILPRVLVFILPALILILSCSLTPAKSVPHEGRWGIYALDIAAQDVRLIYGAGREINGSVLRLDSRGTTLLFAQKIDGDDDTDYEICSVGVEGTGFRRLTDNPYWDVYPAWSPDDDRIAFLSLRRTDLDIYVMDAGGGGERLLYDSGFHDADIDWSAGGIAFTSENRIWMIREDGTNLRPITNPPRAGEWGNTNLPFGDYDPRISPDGTRIVFKRLEDDRSSNGNYNIYTVQIDGGGETRLTGNGYTQGLANWDPSGQRLIFIVSAIDGRGVYDFYEMNADGGNPRSLTPDYFPGNFLAHSAIFSKDGSEVYFIGEWWQ